MIESLKESAQDFLINSNSDAVAIAVIDFKNQSFDSFELNEDGINLDSAQIYFDYASLTKPLTNSFTYIAHDLNDKNLELLLNHKAGLPAWGLLARTNWKKQLESYDIIESKTLYSDFSALRFMLETEKKLSKSYEDIVFDNLDEDIKFWMNMNGKELVYQNGFYKNQPNIGKVHDPNAYNLKCFTSHAGLFGTVDSLSRTLLNFDKKFNLLERVIDVKKTNRFCMGFDTVSDTENTLAGAGCSNTTFGHLGFTGTSFWIDPVRKLGQIILTNSTKYYWYDKKDLNLLRKKVGSSIWKSK